MHFLLSFFFLCSFSIPLYSGDNSLAKTDSLTLSKTHLFQSDPWFGKDKADHFISSAFLTGIGYYLANKELKSSEKSSKYVAAGFSLSLGISKEIVDHLNEKGKSSFKDILADILGIGLGIVIISVGT